MANKQVIKQVGVGSVAALFDDTFEPDHQTSPNETFAKPHAEPTPAAEDPRRPSQLCGLKVHPAANEFPMLSGDELNDFVESVRHAGQLMPVVVDNGVLLEGRNRARAVEILQAEGMDIELEERPWFPASENETPTQFILATNLHRRHLTSDQRAMIAARLAPRIEKELAEKQKGSRIRPGEKRNPSGTNQHTANEHDETPANPDAKSTPPSSQEADPKAANKKKMAASTRGRIAKQAGVSAYKANQAVRAAKGAPSEAIEAVIAGTKKLAEVNREISTERAGTGVAKRRKPRQPIAHAFMPADDFEHEVLRFWTLFVEQKAGITARARARDVLVRIFAAEQKAEKAPSKASDAPGVMVFRDEDKDAFTAVPVPNPSQHPRAPSQESTPAADPQATVNAKRQSKADELDGLIHPANLWGKPLPRASGRRRN